MLLWHWRNLFFIDYHALAQPSALVATFYFATGFGHEAVMIFFVLSGYFIGSSVMRDVGAGAWSWRRYLTNRATRLQIVLLPALALGAAWDLSGLALFGADGVYGGARPAVGHTIINFPVETRLGWPVAIGNALFLQNVRGVPTLGSNTPLWSLSFEWWYYVLFPLAVLALAHRTRPRHRLGYALAAALVGWFVGPTILAFGTIWLLGALVSMAPAPTWTRARWYPPVALALAGAGFVLAATLSRGHVLRPGIRTDFLVGAAFALLLYALLTGLRRSRWPRYQALATALAGCSYTLYLVHVPVLVFLTAWLCGSARWAPDPPHLAAGLAVLAGVFAYAYGLASVTEAHTQGLRRWLGGRRPAAPDTA